MYLGMRGGGDKSKDKTDSLNASSKEEERYIQYVQDGIFLCAKLYFLRMQPTGWYGKVLTYCSCRDFLRKMEEEDKKTKH